MNRLAGVAAFSLVFSTSGFGQSINVPLYLEENGRVIIEVESVPATTGFTQETKFSGFTGRCYYRSAVKTDKPGDGGTKPLVYGVKFQKSGKYLFKIHGYIDNNYSVHENNDIWATFEGVTIPITNVQPVNGYCKTTAGAPDGAWSKWVWGALSICNKNTQWYIEVTAPDTVLLKLSSRSPGYLVDRLIVYQGSAPTDLALPESARLDISATASPARTAAFRSAVLPVSKQRLVMLNGRIVASNAVVKQLNASVVSAGPNAARIRAR